MRKQASLPIFLGLGGLAFAPALAWADDQPAPAAATIVESGSGSMTRSMTTTSKPGEKTVTRVRPPTADQPGQTTTTKTDAQGSVAVAKTLQIPPGSRTTIVTKSAPAIVPKLVPIYFETDSDEIEAISLPLLDATAAAVNRDPKIKLVAVEGHADARGDQAYNVDLTERRAQAVSQALQERGVPADRLESQGYGDARPICSTDAEDCWSQNRRVDIVPHEAQSAKGGASSSSNEK